MMRAAFLILALALHPSLLELVVTHWAGNVLEPDGGAATSDAGGLYDPNGLTGDMPGMYDPDGQMSDAGNMYDPNG